MDFLDSLDLHTTDEKSKRVRSWYLYEQYKSLEKSQLDAAKKLKHKSYQDRILHRELNERRARRQLSEQFDIRHSESHIERTLKSDPSSTPYSGSGSTDSFFVSICEQEDVVKYKEQDNDSQHSETTSKLYDEFKSSNEQIYSLSESINSVVENIDMNENIAEDIKDKLEIVKQNIAEIINIQIETEKECLETYKELCEEKGCEESSNSKEICNENSSATDKYYPKYNNGFLAIWSKLVAFSYNLIQMNRGNCYYDYSSQFLTGILAFDVLRRGISRMSYILQPYVSPVKFTNDEWDTSSITNVNLNQKSVNTKKTSKIYKCCPRRTPKYDEQKCSSFERKYCSEGKWQSRCKCLLENRMNRFQTRGASEPFRSVTKFSGGRNSFKAKLFCKKSQMSQTDNNLNYCDCRQLKKAINPIIKLSKYIDMILQEIKD